eukprot:TRINITY_DN1795_c0_g1_i1.p1 TRINITY_DN1795_c0_g1~~TRINITY_DN1795_c0_g1_i1.p1  ORF type:complete len:100 (-),score=14.71 TRINITY_DN1795_c0_g1_i1:154-426(-)
MADLCHYFIPCKQEALSHSSSRDQLHTYVAAANQALAATKAAQSELLTSAPAWFIARQQQAQPAPGLAPAPWELGRSSSSSYFLFSDDSL